jgi:hypothetical protein
VSLIRWMIKRSVEKEQQDEALRVAIGQLVGPDGRKRLKLPAPYVLAGDRVAIPVEQPPEPVSRDETTEIAEPEPVTHEPETKEEEEVMMSTSTPDSPQAGKREPHLGEALAGIKKVTLKQRLRDLFKQGLPQKEIARILTEEGYRTPTTGVPFRQENVSRLCRQIGLRRYIHARGPHGMKKNKEGVEDNAEIEVKTMKKKTSKQEATQLDLIVVIRSLADTECIDNEMLGSLVRELLTARKE